jgi:hypothetical protein
MSDLILYDVSEGLAAACDPRIVSDTAGFKTAFASAGTLGHPLLWLTSGLAEFWALTLDERKRLLEVAIEAARAIDPGVVIQACTAAMSPKDCPER